LYFNGVYTYFNSDAFYYQMHQYLGKIVFKQFDS
jgi:hypothetical protein